jgi:beta-aspartyl-peptidase (threonine type)
MAGSPLGIICHGGAGRIKDPAAAAAGLDEAIRAGYQLLRQSAEAEKAVVRAVQLMEDNPAFNCGTGSKLTVDGRAEMDAGLMMQDGRFGGVGCITGVRNPIMVADKVMRDTDHLLLCGPGAVAFARRQGFEEHDCVTDRAREQLEEFRRDPAASRFPKSAGHGTVGAVAIDKHGRVAAATSSGGITGRLPGRVGDSCLVGCGTYAGPSGAVSCTGHGEEIMRVMLAREVVEKMRTLPAAVAVTLAMADARRGKLACGVVGLDARGTVGYGHTTPDMSWGYMIADHVFMFTEMKPARKAGA